MIRLGNGVRLILEPRPGADVCAVAVAVGGGSRLDPPGRGGLAHVVEHLMFRERDAAFTRIVEVAGYSDGVNALSHTTFHHLVPRELVGALIALEGRRFARPVATADGLAADRAIVTREIHEALDRSRGGHPWSTVPAALFGDSAVGRAPHGDLADLAAITVADCQALLDSTYVAGNLVVGVVGGFDVDEVTAAVEAGFGAVPPGSGRSGRSAPAPAVSPVVEVDLVGPVPPDTDLTAVGFPTPDPLGEPGPYLALVVLAEILSTHHLPALRGRHPELQHAAFTVGYLGQPMRCGAPDLAVAHLVARSGFATGPALDTALRYIRDAGVPATLVRRAVNRLRLDHYRENDDPLRCVQALVAVETLGFGWEAFSRLGDALDAVEPPAVRAAADRLLHSGRSVVRMRAGTTPSRSTSLARK